MTSSGTSAADVLNGTPENDIISGLGGNDIISGLGASDRLYGDDGSDVLYGARETDDLALPDGNELIVGGAGNDTISGDLGADEIRGGLDNDTITSGPDANVDTVYGQDGNDTIDTVDEPASKDLVYCGVGTNDAVVADDLDVVAADCETVDRLTSDEEAVAQDARVYAADYGVGFEEALRRLSIQEDVGDLQASLEANEGATYGGLRISHSPGFEVIGYFTQNGAQTIQPYVQGTPLDGMVRTEQVAATLSELEAAQAQAIASAEANGVPVEADVNVAANRAELYVTEANRSRLDTSLRSSTGTMPDNVQTITVPALSEPMAFYGGTHLTDCTAGFVVRANNGLEGTTTAGHCPNSGQNWRGGRTVYVDGYVANNADIQYNTTPNVEDKARFYSGVGLRSVRAVRGRSHQPIGKIICKYGKNGGFRCAEIVGRTYKPGYVASANSTFLRARRRGDDLVRQGDSGGPVFSGYTALGTISGRFQGDMIYMAINYVDSAPIGVDKVQTR